MYRSARGGGGCSLGGGRILIALILVGVALFTYFSQRVYNPVTDETQHISITPQQEVALGLQAAPEMEQEFGGESQDAQGQALVDKVCANIVKSSSASQTDYPFECHLLGDQQTINAFSLPGGQVFITEALYKHLETEGQLAGVLGHEIGHVVARHGAEHIAKQQLTEGLTGAAVVASYDPNNPNSAYAAQFAMLIGELVTLKYGRDDELESDRLGVRFMSEAGYDPRAMLRVMQILEESSSGGRPPEFFSTHPNPENRLQRIQQAIDEKFPSGVPDGMVQ